MRISLPLLLSVLLPAVAAAPQHVSTAQKSGDVSRRSAPAQWSIGYWNSLGNPPCPIPDIDMDALTHIVHWAALVGADGSLDLRTHNMVEDAPPLIRAAHEAGVKVVFGVVNPYWKGQKGNIAAAVARHRRALVNDILDAVDQYGYDGVDIDWEGSSPFPGIDSLARDLRERLGERLLMAAASVADYRNWGSVQRHFDRINVMTYDLERAGSPYSWYNSAVFGPSDNAAWSIDLAVKRYTANGVPASKLGIGIPFYGYRWDGMAGPKRPYERAAEPRQVHYNRILPLVSERAASWDEEAKVPYLRLPGGYITYDDERSVTEKVQYAKDKNLGGWIIWNLSMDYFPGRPRKHPLLDAIKAAR
jgi:chitinase